MTATEPTIGFDESSATVDAETIARGFGIAAGDVQPLMRSGAITSRCEIGEGEDAGLTRLTFFYRGGRFRIVADATGRVVRQSAIDFGDRPIPAALKR